MSDNIIGIRIKKLRESEGLTQLELATKLGLTRETAIVNYEKGYSIPKDSIKFKMCDLFNCSLDYLLGKSELRTGKEPFSLRLNRALTIKKITPEELAREFGVDKPIILQYLKEGVVPKSKNIKKIAEILNVNPDWLMGYDVPMNVYTKINENELNVAFSSGYDGLNETNKNIIMEHIQFLTSQQNKNNNKKD